MFNLYSVSAFNPETGEILLPVTEVTAKDADSANNKAIGKLSENLPEGKTLDEVLDQVSVRVRPF